MFMVKLNSYFFGKNQLKLIQMSDQNIISSPKTFYEIPDISVPELVNKLLSKYDKHSVCVIDANSDSKLTVKELISKSTVIAMSFVKRGVIKSDIILTFAENCIELVIVLFAAMFLGVTIYPISPTVNVHQLEQLFDILNQTVVITSKQKAEIVCKILRNTKRKSVIKFMTILDANYDSYVTFDEMLKEGQNQSLDIIPFYSVKPKKDLFVYIQSSGTSGAPKTVMVSHKAIVAAILGMTNADKSGLKERLVFSLVTPFGYISGITLLFGYIACGATLVIYKGYNEEIILKSVEKYRINFMSFVPTFGYQLIYGDLVDKYDLSSVRSMATYGSAINGNIAKAIIKKYKVYIQEVYGMTEFGLITLFPDFYNTEYIEGNLGRPAHNTQMKVINLNSGQSLGPNVDGEICVRGPKLFSGYLNNVLATNYTIDDEGWLHTGDIGHYDEKNRFFITEKIKELIKVGTKQVSPTELEQFLLTHENVAEVAVVGVKHETQTQWPRAYVKCAENSCVSEKKIQEFVADALGVAKQLRAGVVFVDQIRRTTVGKIDRRFYKQLVANEVIKSERKLSKYEIGFKFD